VFESRATVPLLALTVVLASVVALWGWKEASAARGERDDYKAQLDASQALLRGVQINLRKVTSNYATAELRLRQLHGENPDRPTADGVRKLLCERGNCATVDPVPTPSD
jgi:hypothetical protein